MDWTSLIAILGLIIGYNQFNSKLKQQKDDLQLQILSQQNKTYKELITVERIKNYNKLRDAMSTMLASLNDFSMYMSEQGALTEHFNELDEKLTHDQSTINSANLNDDDPLLDLYKQAIDDDDELGHITRDLLRNIGKTKYKLLLILNPNDVKYNKVVIILVKKYISKAYHFKIADMKTTVKIEESLIKIEEDLVEMFQIYLKKEWTKIEKEAKELYDVNQLSQPDLNKKEYKNYTSQNSNHEIIL